MSPTVYALCRKLNVFDLSPTVTEETMNRLSLLARVNFLFSKRDQLAELRVMLKSTRPIATSINARLSHSARRIVQKSGP